MIIEMATSAIISIGSAPTYGASETALFVAQEAESGVSLGGQLYLWHGGQRRIE